MCSWAPPRRSLARSSGVTGDGLDGSRSLRADDARIGLHKGAQVPAPRAPAGTDVTRHGLRLLDVDVGIQHDGEKIIRGIPRDEPFATPVIGHTHLVDR